LFNEKKRFLAEEAFFVFSASERNEPGRQGMPKSRHPDLLGKWMSPIW
jgi:hypothetical protein